MESFKKSSHEVDHVEIDVPDPPSGHDHNANGFPGHAVLTREASVKFWHGEESSSRSSNIMEGELIRKPSDSYGELSLTLDVDPEIGSTCGHNSSDNNDAGVSFKRPVTTEIGSETPPIWKANNNNSTSFDDGKSTATEESDNEAEVVKCTSSRSFIRTPSMMRTKARSRLVDPLDHNNSNVQKSSRLSGRMPRYSTPMSSPFFSGKLGKTGELEDDDNGEEDLPLEFKKTNMSFIFLLEWMILVLLTTSLICVLAIPGLKAKYIVNFKLWKWLIVLLVVVSGRLVSSGGTKLVVFFIERNFVLRKKLLYFVYGIRSAVQNCFWLGLVLITWCFLLNKRVEKEVTNTKNLKYVTRTLICLLVGTLLWLVKTLIIKVLASSFHVSTYFDRIRETLFSQFVIETLSGSPVAEMERTAEEERKMEAEIQTLEAAGATVPQDLKSAAGLSQSTKSGRTGATGRSMRFSGVSPMRPSNYNNEGITMNNLQRLNTQNISAWKMKRLMKIVRRGFVSTLDEQTDVPVYEDETAVMIRSEKEAKAVARKIFGNVAKPGSRYIYLDDLMRFMSEDEASRTLFACGATADHEPQRVSKSGLKNWLVNAFRDRKALTLTLNDTKTVVNKLHRIISVIVGIVIVVIWLLILEIASVKFIVFLMSELVLLAFMFGNTCKMMFESIVFLFVMHPFDVGDRCEIDGVQMVVEEMNILNTIFLRYDNQKVMFPNSTLSTRPIGNYYRSPDMGDGIEFFVHMATPSEKISLMKQRIISYIEGRKDHWMPSPMVITKEFEDLNRVRMAVWLCHTINHQDMGEKFSRRAMLMEEMIKIFKDLDIQYRFLPLDINVRSLPPATTSRLPPTWVVNPQ